MSGVMSKEADNCVGDVPNFVGVSFTCQGGAWHSNTSITMEECTSAKVNGPMVVNGDLVLGYRSVITYEPPDLFTSPLITVRGCAHFNRSFLRVNLTHNIVQDIIYASKLKQENHWLYLLPLEVACDSINATMLDMLPEVHWNYGVQINTTVINSKKSPITFFEIQPGHSAIQLGFLSGSVAGPQTWFVVLLAILGAFILIVIVGEIIQCVSTPQKKNPHTPGRPSINGDDSMVSLLEDSE